MPGGHTDCVTGTQCHWNVFRVCNTTRMETNSVSKLLLDIYGKKWYFITTDYAFGHSLQQGFEASLKAAGGTELGADYDAARHHRLLGQSDQGAVDQSGRAHPAAGRRRHDQLPQAGGAIRPRQEDPHRRRAAGARSQRGPAARSAVRRLGVRMVLEAARRAACRGVRRRRPQAQRRQGADRAHLVRLSPRSIPASSPPRRRSRSMPSRWPRRCRAWCCRRRSR